MAEYEFIYLVKEWATGFSIQRANALNVDVLLDTLFSVGSGNIYLARGVCTQEWKPLDSWTKDTSGDLMGYWKDSHSHGGYHHRFYENTAYPLGMNRVTVYIPHKNIRKLDRL